MNKKKKLLPLTTLPPINETRPQQFVRFEHESDRSFTDIRPIFFQVHVCPKASGSAYFSQGTTLKLLSSVHGPKPLPTRYSQTNKLNGAVFVEVTFTPYYNAYLGRSSQDKNAIKDRLSNILIETFTSLMLTETFPGSCIEIMLTVIEACDGGLISSAINCVALALVDAAVPIRDLCVAVTIGIYFPDNKNSNNEQTENFKQVPVFLVDPTKQELNHSSFYGEFTLALCVTNSLVVYIDGILKTNHNNNRELTNYSNNIELTNHSLSLAETICCTIGRSFREQLKQQILQRSKQNETDKQLIEECLQILQKKE